MYGDPGIPLGDKAAIEKGLGSENAGLADNLMELAASYAANGKCMYAEPLYWRALSIRRKQLGEMHEQVAETLICLGALYETYEQYPEAERFYQWALKIQEIALGPNVRETAVTLESLARVIREQRRLEEAVDFDLKAQDIWSSLSPQTQAD
jgi:tetratricopeptide (TPR) repeat protein